MALSWHSGWIKFLFWSKAEKGETHIGLIWSSSSTVCERGRPDVWRYICQIFFALSQYLSQYVPNIFSFESMFESIFESIFAKDFEPPGKPSLVLEPPPPALSMCFPPHRKPAQNSSDARKYYFYISFIEIHRASVITIFTSAVLPTLLPRPPTATIFLKGSYRHKKSFLSSHCVWFCKMVNSDPKSDRIDQVRFFTCAAPRRQRPTL